MGQNTLDTDSFNGTNGATLPTYNANWTKLGTDSNNCLIEGTPGVGATSAAGTYSGDYRTGQTWTNDQFAQATVDANSLTNGQSFMVGVRGQTSGTMQCYAAGWNQNHNFDQHFYIDIVQAASGGAQLATDVGVNVQGGDVINMQVVGTVLTATLTRSASVISTLTYDTKNDSTKFSTGNPCLIIENSSAAQRDGGTWSAGSVAAAPVGSTATVSLPNLEGGMYPTYIAGGLS